MDKTTHQLQQLRYAIEQRTGRSHTTPKDFDILAAEIQEQTSERVSASTLKRIWGYVESDNTPRFSTLNLLSRFVGHSDWQEFCNSLNTGTDTFTNDQEEEGEDTADSQEQESEPTKENRGNSKRNLIRWLTGIAVVLIAILLFIPFLRPSTHIDTCLILTKGQHFAQPADYLALFGITPTNHYWDEPLPHHQGIIVWSPQYQHPNWHNEGSIYSLFPTITEYWTPTIEQCDSVSPSLIRQKNENLFFTVMRTNELRITFMRGIADNDSCTFLGIYRVDLNQSDSTHVVWQRIAEQCDLRNLNYLEELKN